MTALHGHKPRDTHQSTSLRALHAVFAAAVAVWVAAVPGCMCGTPTLPDPPAACDADGVGCLPDEQCVEGACVRREKCTADTDCKSAAWECVFPAQRCELRTGFGEMCSAELPCDPGAFCALGRCRETGASVPCAKRSDCPAGLVCDQQSFFCIERGPCTLSETYPELACERDSTCDEASGFCLLENQGECTPETAADDCGAGQKCDTAGRCVQCLADGDCGVGLVCNVRAGRCESEDLCQSDADCPSHLFCDPVTALCQVPPPPCTSDDDCQIAEVCNRVSGVCELPGGACIDDRLEDNDTPAGAEVVEVEGAPVVLDELMLCPDDDDVFAVDLTAGQRLDVALTGTDPRARATAWIVDSAAGQSLAFTETAPRGDGRLGFVADQDGRYTVRVTALLAPSPYDATFAVTDDVACTADMFETAGGNNAVSTATTLDVGASRAVLASLCRGDADYYQVALAAGEKLTATVTPADGTVDLDLALYSAQTGALLATARTAAALESVAARVGDAQDVVLGVTARPSDASAYQLDLVRSPAFVCTADDAEPNDSVMAPDMPTAVTARTARFDHTLCADDVDLYALTVQDFDRLLITALATETATVRVDVLDAHSLEVLATADSSGGTTALAYAPGVTRDVLVRTATPLGGETPLRLDIDRVVDGACAPDVLEPNDSQQAAAPLADGTTTLNLCPGDVDFFAVTAEADSIFKLDLAFNRAGGDLDLMVFGADGQQVLATSDQSGATESLSVRAPVTGTYAVRVFALGTAQSTYDLSLTRIGAP